MSLTRRIACGTMAVLMAFSVTGCAKKADTSYIATLGEEKIPAGIYLYNLLTAYTNAKNKLPPDATNPLKEEVEGVPGPQWIEEQAKKAMTFTLATEQLFQQLDLSFTVAEEETMEQEVTGLLEVYPDLAAGFQANGISKESYQRVVRSNYMQTKVFPAYYDAEKGVEPVEKSVVTEKYNTDYRRAWIMEFAFFDSKTETEITEEQKTNLQTLSDEYVKQINAGDDVAKVFADYQVRKGVAEEALEKEPKVSLLNIPNTTLPPEFFTQLDKAKVGEAIKVSNEDGIFVAVKYDLNENPFDFEAMYNSILFELKETEFSAMLEKRAEDLNNTMTYNEEALARYTADKVKP